MVAINFVSFLLLCLEQLKNKKIMQEATIKHVEIDVNNNSWEILMQTYNGIPDELLAKASSYISQKCNIPTVIFYQDIVDLPQEVARHWSIIVQNAANGNPTLFSILNQASHSVDGNKIMIDFKGDILKIFYALIILKKLYLKLFKLWYIALVMLSVALIVNNNLQ